MEKRDYYLKYKENRCIAFHESGGCVQFQEYKMFGIYEYVGYHRRKYHFYSNELGLDVFLTKEEFNNINDVSYNVDI